MALGYLLTFGTYGTHLYGDERGAWRARDGYQEPNELQRAACIERMREDPFVLDEAAREVVLKAIVNVAAHRKWTLRAVHIRREHVHCVVRLPEGIRPMKAVADFKAYGTRALREHGIHREKYWAERGHCVFLWDHDHIREACEYVYDKQGAPMARYARDDSFPDPLGR